ncbi:protein-cysteine N-palmitoyltransferase HHAT-like [Clytia hemisphaerica]|uniref:Uncharacterized protein n=1 Tax=Clytia hemisphaerica TaxID=252671 RepID=A0A7M5V3R3_9CNID
MSSSPAPQTTSTTKSKFLHMKLSSSIERNFYWIIWLTSIIYPFYHSHTTSMKYFDQIKDDLTPSWFGLHKDVSDYEWTFWRSMAFLLAALFSINSAIVFLVKRFIPAESQHLLILLSTLILQGAVISIKGLLVVLLFTTLSYYLLDRTKRISTIWISSIILLYIINNHDWKTKLFEYMRIHKDSYDLVKLVLMMCILRIISFSNFYLRSKDRQHDLDLPKLITFCLYIPVCYNGPIINFDTFYKDVYQTARQYSITEITKDVVYTLANIFALEIFFHFIYANTLCVYHDILQEMTVFDAISLFWIHLHIFNIKYFIFYRFSGIFAKVDGVEPPGPPKCIASLYTFVDMWRYFDKGLNTFLFQNIYIPLGGSAQGFGKQTLASCLCFSFVGYWHGADKSLMFWALTNWLGIVIESLGTRIIKTNIYRNTINRFGCLAHRRLCALGGAFSVFTLIFTNMVFLVGHDSAVILLYRVFSVWHCPLICLFVFYCGNNCSIDASYT